MLKAKCTQHGFSRETRWWSSILIIISNYDIIAVDAHFKIIIHTDIYKIQIQKRNGKINHIHPLVFTTLGRCHFQGWFGPCDVTSANFHAFDSAVLIRLVDFVYSIKHVHLILKQASIVWESNSLIVCDVAKPKSVHSAPSVCQNGRSHNGYILFSLFSPLCFWFLMSYNVRMYMYTVITVNDSVQDMNRSFEGGYFLQLKKYTEFMKISVIMLRVKSVHSFALRLTLLNYNAIRRRTIKKTEFPKHKRQHNQSQQ